MQTIKESILIFSMFFIQAAHGQTLAPLEIKGITPDSLLDCAHVESISKPGPIGPKGCYTDSKTLFRKTSFAGMESTLIINKSQHGEVVAVMVKGFLFESVALSLSEKFGKPEIVESEMQNGFGAKFQQVTMIWKDGDKKMVLEKHSTKVNTPSLVLSGKLALQMTLKPSSDL